MHNSILLMKEFVGVIVDVLKYEDSQEFFFSKYVLGMFFEWKTFQRLSINTHLILISPENVLQP